MVAPVERQIVNLRALHHAAERRRGRVELQRRFIRGHGDGVRDVAGLQRDVQFGVLRNGEFEAFLPPQLEPMHLNFQLVLTGFQKREIVLPIVAGRERAFQS